MTSDKYLATVFDVTQKFFVATCTILMLHKSYTKFIMPAGIMSLARINLAGLIRYLMNHPVKPVIQTDQFESGHSSDGERISGLTGFGSDLYTNKYNK